MRLPVYDSSSPNDRIFINKSIVYPTILGSYASDCLFLYPLQILTEAVQTNDTISQPFYFLI